MAVFSIPGNIKQMFLPFVLDPTAQLNQVQYNQAKDVKGKPQIFSFRNSSQEQKNDQVVGKISICPQSFCTAITDDISYKLLYQKDAKNAQSIDINSIFDSIPGIQIREFLPDTRLDQALDFFNKVMSKVISLFKADKKTADEAAKKTKTENESQLDEGIIDKITRTCKYAVKYLTGFEYPNIYTDTFGTESLPTTCKDTGNLTTYIHKFPYIMWYQLQSCTSTNLYELPCIIDSKDMYSSDGHAGWPSAGLSLTNQTMTGIPLLGPLVKSLLGNVNVSFMPWWDAKEGNSTPTPDVVVKFDLFNDNAENALYNFIFVNTLIPNAKWVQYNLFQHSPHLYDIKLEGYGRLFACSGSFKVQQRGILRDMTDKWIDIYLKKHINSSCMSDDFCESIKKNKLIKIPDVYHVEMTFRSLLPDTFNNYLFSYSSNSNIITTYSDKIRTDSKAPDLLTDGVSKMIDNVIKVWNGELQTNDTKVLDSAAT